MNANWSKWIKASVYNFLETELAPTFTFFEGNTRKTGDQEFFFEVRIDGPIIYRQAKNTWKHVIQVNILCVAYLARNGFDLTRLVGRAGSALSKKIPVYDGDGALLGCLALDDTAREKYLRMREYGQIGPKVQQLQGTAEVTLYIELEG